ncbi:MAG: tetratricopeptide repeat protein [Treponema sp.]|jgi:tetratricopeptide (TPR) repeat protein|nr:tetratricopeptide repeat protein [Treponema sp.]
MFGFIKKLFGFHKPPAEEFDPNALREEQWTADFKAGGAEKIRFTITSEKSYIANLRTGEAGTSLVLTLLKPNCMVWTEDSLFRYYDLAFRGRVRLDARGGYAAAGFMFRMVDDGSYYLALVSNRGYFRLDLVRNYTPLALAGWTEAPGLLRAENAEDAPPVIEYDLELINYGEKILLLINGLWAAEINDSSLSAGRISFCAVNYHAAEGPDASRRPVSPDDPAPSGGAVSEAALLEFSLDSRIAEVESRYNGLAGTARSEERIRLAETFTALGQANPALVQLRRAWETGGPKRKKELLLGAKLAMALERWDEAGEYIDACLAGEDRDASEEDAGHIRNAGNHKAALLYSTGRYGELISWAASRPDSGYADPASLYNLLGHAFFHTGDYEKAAAAYDRAFALDGSKGLAARNAAAAYELLGAGEKALDRYFKAGKVFLSQDQYQDLGLLIPKFRLLGITGTGKAPAPGAAGVPLWEIHALIGKWAFGVEDWALAEQELKRAEEIRAALKAARGAEAGTDPDPALYYLQGLLLIRGGKRKRALSLLELAVKYAPDYPLFRFRLAENRFLLNQKPDDPALRSDLEAALRVKKEEEPETFGWVNNFAAHIALSRGEADRAAAYLENAAAVLGDLPEVRVNRAVSLYLGGALNRALEILESRPEDDPEGIMANCAGNLLVRAGRFEEAGVHYQRALAAAPGNSQYRHNRASCLIELARYGEADDVLTGGGEVTPDLLERIAFVAEKKGEYKRAEAAVREALKTDPDHVPSLFHLGWNCASSGRWDELGPLLERLERLDLSGENAKRRDELAARREEALFRRVNCASCGREWVVSRDPPPVPALKLYAMPPDDMPAGTCPGCGKSYCVGCCKNSLDETGRFICPGCGKTLKLSDGGLKEIVRIWADENIKP